MFRKRPRDPGSAPATPQGTPLVPRVLDAINILPRILEVFKDNRGKMSSKRFGAGALVAAGIALVDAGASTMQPMQFWGGLALCGMGVVLFGLTRWEGGKDEPPTAG